MGQAAAGGGQVVALAAADLRIEHPHQRGGDVGAGADAGSTCLSSSGSQSRSRQTSQPYTFFGLHPVAHRAQRRDGAQRDRHVGIVLVGRVVQVDVLGLRRPRRIASRSSTTAVSFGFFTSRAGEGELDLAGVLAHVGGLALLEHAHLLHLLVGVIAVDTGARAAGAVGHHHAGEPLVLAAEALGDAVVGHDLDIVLVRGDAEMRGAREGGVGRVPSGTKKSAVDL